MIARHLYAELLRGANRSTVALFSLCVALTLFAMSNAEPQHHRPLWGFEQAAIFVATLLMGRAATTAAGDFGAGTIRPWLISGPSRLSAFAGKLAATVLLSAGMSVAIGLTGYLAAGLFGPAARAGEALEVTAQLTVAAAALSLFGHAAGVATASVPVALTVTIGWVLPAEAVLSGRSATLDRWLPGQLLHGVTLGEHPAGMSHAGAVVHAVASFLALEALALLVFLHRDITV